MNLSGSPYCPQNTYSLGNLASIYLFRLIPSPFFHILQLHFQTRNLGTPRPSRAPVLPGDWASDYLLCPFFVVTALSPPHYPAQHTQERWGEKSSCYNYHQNL